MESIENAKRIGLKYGIWAALIIISLSIVALILTTYLMIDNFGSSVETVFYILFWDRLTETVLGLSVFAFLIWKMSQKAGVNIIVGEEEYTKEGALAVLPAYGAMAFVMIIASYIRYGIKSTANFGLIMDNIFTPLGWALIVGFIPIAIAGIWLGNKIDSQH